MGVNYLTDKAVTKKSKIADYGTFATKKINQGELIAVFGGVVMDYQTWSSLPESVHDKVLQIGDEVFIGPQIPKDLGDGDYINHSCDPNAGIKGQIYLVAMRDIQAGEEITFDYAMTIAESIKFKMKCNCGSRYCRGLITETDWSLPELQKKYQGYFSHYIQQKIEQLKSFFQETSRVS